MKKVEKARKESGTNVILCQLRNMVGQFKKTYLLDIKIPQFLTSTRIQKCLI